MEKKLIEERYALEHISELLEELKCGSIDVNNARYHHNTDYYSASSIVRCGILSMQSMNNLGVRRYSKYFLEVMNDTESHINGKDGISLAVAGLDDLYSDEFEYDPFDRDKVDFLITSDIKASRNSVHYGNEFISREDITPSSIRSIDIRLLECLKKLENKSCNIEVIQEMVDRYNSLKQIALELKKCALEIPIREMSCSTGALLNVEKTANGPIIKLKK